MKNNISAPYLIEITAYNYEWHFRYAGSDGQLHTKDDIIDNQNLFLPQATKVIITLKSEDYLYFFELPEYRQIALAVPDQIHQISFIPDRVGISNLKGNQMCAYTHENLMGTLTVYTPLRFWWWSLIMRIGN